MFNFETRKPVSTCLSERLLAQYRLRRHTESAFLGEFACLLVAVFGRQGGVMRKDTHFMQLDWEYFFRCRKP